MIDTPNPPSPILSAAQLDELVETTTGAVTLLDMRWRLGGAPGLAGYLSGHLPGAVYVDLDTELADPPGAGGRHPLPDPERFTAAMRRAGVRDEQPVVCYDDTDGSPAARAWWLLRYFGHRDVRVLDGGLLAWQESGGRVVTEASDVREGDFTPKPAAMPVLDAEGVASLARTGALLDVRTEPRYRAESEPVDPVAGHIPGAVSAPAGETLDPTGRLLDPEALAKHFAGVGAFPDTPVGVYCGSGVTAAQQVLALEVAGIQAALYAGSWSHWITDASRPVAIGPDPG